MNKLNTSKLVQYWTKASDLDYKSATEIANLSKQYVQALFFLHLSLEKILKGFIVQETKNHAPYSHNLSFLAEKTEVPLRLRFQNYCKMVECCARGFQNN